MNAKDQAPTTSAAVVRPPKVSLLVPVYNEEENLPILLDQIRTAMEGASLDFEVLAVNDGSTDGSMRVLRELASHEPRLRVISFRRNFGQTAALMAAIDHASGEVLVPIDADLQNDPSDVPALLQRLDQGYDVVSGWRKDRKDHVVRRNFIGRIANGLISAISNVHLHDYGCTLKAYRREVMSGFRLYGEMHRFVPIYARWQGARVTEMPVRHHPRRFGKSKYGLERVAKVLLDLAVVIFLHKYLAKPIYVFGGFGLVSLVLALAAFLLMIYLRLFEGISMILTPLPTLVAMTFLTGVTSILLGLLAEIVVRTYFEAQGHPVYMVRETINVEPRR
jgi:dolichol-phosphate mannosyltransferase